MRTTLATEEISESERKVMSLSGPEKAAILILCLGEQRGSEMMKDFEEREIQRITRAMSGLGPINAEVAELVLAEFAGIVSRYTTNSEDAAKSLLLNFLPEEKVDSIMKEIGSTTREKALWAELGTVDEKAFAEYLENEQDQTIAVIASNLPAEFAARVLPLLGDRMVDIAERMVQLRDVPDNLIAQIEDALRSDVLDTADNAANAVVSKRMAEVFNFLDETQFETISAKLSGSLPDEFAAIQDRMFTFRDMIKIEGQDLARVMRGVEGNTVPLALKGANDQLREHFLSALPGRSRDMLVGEMEAMGPVRAKDAREAQTHVVDCALRLIEQEVIRLTSDEDDQEEYIE